MKERRPVSLKRLHFGLSTGRVGHQRLTVEECAFLDIREFARKGVLDVGLGTVHDLTSIDPDTETPRKMFLWVEKVGIDCERLIFRYSAPNADFRPENAIQYAVEVISGPCRFGGKRHWFRCPLLRGSSSCGKRVLKLFLPPGGRYFGCRKCYDLTYWSVQQHDQRGNRQPKFFREPLQRLEGRRTDTALDQTQKIHRDVYQFGKSFLAHPALYADLTHACSKLLSQSGHLEGISKRQSPVVSLRVPPNEITGTPVVLHGPSSAVSRNLCSKSNRKHSMEGNPCRVLI